MRNSFGDKVRLQHIYDAILQIESYVDESTYDIFESNPMMQFASVKQLEIIEKLQIIFLSISKVYILKYSGGR